MLNQQGVMPGYSQHVSPQTTAVPTEFLPSFVGANGAHIPNLGPESFSSPDRPLQPPTEPEEIQSLVASTRKEIPLEAEIVPEELEPPKVRYPRMAKLVSEPKTRRLKVKRSAKGKLRGRSVIAELVSPTLGRASRISKRLFRGRSRTSESLRLQAENNRQSQVAKM